MPEQKIVQHRRDIYSNYAASKLKPGEIAMITSGDPNSSSGKSVYACIAAGDVIQLATRDELHTYDQAAEAARDDAVSAKTAAQNAQSIAQSAQTAAESAQSAAQSAQTAAETAQAAAESAAQTAAESATSAVQNAAETALTRAETAKTAAETAATNAQSALSSVNEKASQINAIVLAQHVIEVGDNATDVNGSVYIYLSNDFMEALGTGGIYRVFLQEEGEGKVYVSEKTDTFFVVSGTEELAFSWMVII